MWILASIEHTALLQDTHYTRRTEDLGRATAQVRIKRVPEVCPSSTRESGDVPSTSRPGSSRRRRRGVPRRSSRYALLDVTLQAARQSSRNPLLWSTASCKVYMAPGSKDLLLEPCRWLQDKKDRAGSHKKEHLSSGLPCQRACQALVCSKQLSTGCTRKLTLCLWIAMPESLVYLKKQASLPGSDKYISTH